MKGELGSSRASSRETAKTMSRVTAGGVHPLPLSPQFRNSMAPLGPEVLDSDSVAPDCPQVGSVKPKRPWPARELEDTVEAEAEAEAEKVDDGVVVAAAGEKVFMADFCHSFEEGEEEDVAVEVKG